ncbi:MAG: class I SAM-dependent methyltransferase, partial [Anaerolineales bacterium]
MNEYQYSTYGNNISEVYDEFYAEFDPASIELLAKLAGDGPALELGIGTGRVAIPLHEKGIKLHGIDASEAMLSKLKAKGGGAEIKTLTGSFARFNIEQSFRLIYVIFNTFFALLTQEEQVQCFQTVSDHLSEDGAFLIEAFVPDLKRFEDFQTVRAVSVTEDLVRLEVTQHDPLFQHIISQHVVIDPE